jgi:hypothetical protein
MRQNNFNEEKNGTVYAARATAHYVDNQIPLPKH